jgi:sugar phosphate isomerase/epimerase
MKENVSPLSKSNFPKTPSGNPKDFKVKTCLHSVSYSGLWRGQAFLNVDEFITKASQLGYDGVELGTKRPHASPLDYNEDARKRLRDKFAELKLDLVCLAGYNDFTAGIDKVGVAHMEIQALYIGELARLARDLGTNMVRIYTGYERPDLPYDRQYAIVLEGIQIAARIAADYGVTLILQNHHDIALHHTAMKWLLDEINLPNVKAAFDAWSPTVIGMTPAEIQEAVRIMSPYLVHTTTADYEKQPRYKYEFLQTYYTPLLPQNRMVMMGEGYIDYKPFINTLKEIGYQGYITYEMCEVLRGGGSIENLDKSAKAFLDYVKQFS